MSPNAKLTVRPMEVQAGHALMLKLLFVKSAIMRVSLTMRINGQLPIAGHERFALGADWALAQGFIEAKDSKGRLGIMARAKDDICGALYLTKAGKAWLREQGTDFGSSLLYREMLVRAAALKAEGLSLIVEAA